MHVSVYTYRRGRVLHRQKDRAGGEGTVSRVFETRGLSNDNTTAVPLQHVWKASYGPPFFPAQNADLGPWDLSNPENWTMPCAAPVWTEYRPSGINTPPTLLLSHFTQAFLRRIPRLLANCPYCYDFFKAGPKTPSLHHPIVPCPQSTISFQISSLASDRLAPPRPPSC